MPRGLQLTLPEQEKIRAYKDCGLSNRQIAIKMKRSKVVINNFVNKGELYGKIKRKGPMPKLTARDKRRVIAIASQKNCSGSQIKKELNAPVTVRRIQQILHESPHLKWAKRKKKPQLKAHHKTARLKFAKKYMSWTSEWQKVVFSDEKKFNLDGPDGCQYYWHDLRKNRDVRMSRNFGGGSVLIWGAFSYNGKTPICIITTKMNSIKYTELLEDALIEHSDDISCPDWIFQQDNAAIHTSSYTKEFLRSHNVDVLDWPACSPDLNPIENLWGLMARRVYQNGRQFHDVAELKTAIKEIWAEISIETLRKLTESMPNRLFHVIRNNGSHTKY